MFWYTVHLRAVYHVRHGSFRANLKGGFLCILDHLMHAYRAAIEREENAGSQAVQCCFLVFLGSLFIVSFGSKVYSMVAGRQKMHQILEASSILHYGYCIWCFIGLRFLKTMDTVVDKSRTVSGCDCLRQFLPLKCKQKADFFHTVSVN